MGSMKRTCHAIAVFYVTMKISKEEDPMRAYILTMETSIMLMRLLLMKASVHWGGKPLNFLIYERSRIIAPKAY